MGYVSKHFPFKCNRPDQSNACYDNEYIPGMGSTQFLFIPAGTCSISCSRCCCLSSRLSFCRADCIMAAWESEPSGFWKHQNMSTVITMLKSAYIYDSVRRCKDRDFKLNQFNIEKGENSRIKLTPTTGWHFLLTILNTKIKLTLSVD